MKRALRTALALGLLLAAPLAQPGAAGYRLESATVLPSTNTDWDYLAFDEARSYLFIARRGDGLTVFDVKRQQVVKNVDGTKGANGIVLLPEFDRVHVANTDGSVSVLTLSSLTLRARIALDTQALNGVFYEPATRRVIALTGKRSKTSTFFSLDPDSGKLLSRTDFDSTKMDTPVADGRGTVYAPVRDKDQILKLAAANLDIQQTWPTGACEQPVALELDQPSARLFVACRGASPILLVMDISNGKAVATIPIGRGVDGMVVDHENGLIVTSNGADANLVVIEQVGPDQYRLVETVATRPMARVLATDPRSKKLYTVTAGHSTPAGAAPVFHENSFSVLTYARNP